MGFPKRGMVFDRRLGTLRPVGEALHLTSANLGWQGYRLEQLYFPRLESHEWVWLDHVVIVQLKEAFALEWKEGSHYAIRHILPGQFSLRPCQSCSSARSRDAAEFLTLSLEPTFLAMACSELADPGQLELLPQNGVADRFVEGVCLALQREVEQGGSSGRLYRDALATSLAVHLASKYATQKRPDHTSSVSRLSPRVVRQAMEFMHERFNEDLGLPEIAAAVGLSAFHFARLFKQGTGLSPHQFLLQQRVERAKHLLLRGELSIAAVAVAVGFYDQSHLGFHFKRLCGLTPKEFAERCHGRLHAHPPVPEAKPPRGFVPVNGGP
ncbi:MAG: helix-turn-helix transcriptional regulator [Verrucomicrobia bacterium]|nr:helix-turn-helix transcriptional regulator [Verrucomicrobiota bacterium]